jgi:hypothetical protein
MKTITTAWIAPLALVAGCSASNGSTDGIPESTVPTTTVVNQPGGITSKILMPPLELESPLPVEPGGGSVGTLTPGVTILPGGDGTTTPGGDGTTTQPGGDGTTTPPAGDGTTTPPAGDGTPTTDIPVAPIQIPIEIETPPAPICPGIIDGNPTCADVFAAGASSVKIESLKDGTYASSDGAFSVDVAFANPLLSYSSAAGPLLGVLVKGGSHAQCYLPGTSGTGLTTPAGEGISHVEFCYGMLP